MKLISAVLFVSLPFASVTIAAPTPNIRIAAYNLENLFDANHDEGKQDWAFLPIAHPGKAAGCREGAPSHLRSCLETDWTPAHAALKVEQMKKALLSQGTLPDLLAVEEVENLSILREFATAVGFSNVILEEGEDERGIDVGLLFNTEKVEYLEHRAHRIQIPTNQTRDILAVYFRRKTAADARETLAVYVNHWPSQGNPPRDRVLAAEKLRDLIQTDRDRFGAGNLMVVALGDFNTVDADHPHPFSSVLLNASDANALLDLRTHFNTQFPIESRQLPIGTYFFPPKMAWQDLDHIFISKNLVDQKGADVELRAFRVHNAPEILGSVNYPNGPLSGSLVTGVPKPYNVRTLNPPDAGFSDHFSISIEIKN